MNLIIDGQFIEVHQWYRRIGEFMPLSWDEWWRLPADGDPVAVAGDVIRTMAAMPGLTVAGIYTHLPFADQAGRQWAVGKGGAFSELLDGLARDGVRPAVTQMWGSSGVLADLPDATNTVCVGHALYGLSPFNDATLTAGIVTTPSSRRKSTRGVWRFSLSLRGSPARLPAGAGPALRLGVQLATDEPARSVSLLAGSRDGRVWLLTANGTLQPTRSINIGSELSGTVLKVHVDVNDRVKKGQVLDRKSVV